MFHVEHLDCSTWNIVERFQPFSGVDKRHPQKGCTCAESSRFGLKIHGIALYTASMSTAAISIDEFQALEQKVLRAVEIVKREREARATAEAEITSLREQIEVLTSVHAETASSLQAMEKERAEVRQRVEKMLTQMDELL
jgi:hypothetical protein